MAPTPTQQATFRSDYCGRGELSERQQFLNQLLTTIKCLACEWNIAVLMTNQMQSDPGSGMTFVPGEGEERGEGG